MIIPPLIVDYNGQHKDSQYDGMSISRGFELGFELEICRMQLSRLGWVRFRSFNLLPKVRDYNTQLYYIPSGKRLHNYGKSPCWMGKSMISMAIFNSYVTNITRGYIVVSTHVHDMRVLNPKKTSDFTSIKNRDSVSKKHSEYGHFLGGGGYPLVN